MLLRFPEEAERQVYIEAISREYGIEARSLQDMVRNLSARMTERDIENYNSREDVRIIQPENVHYPPSVNSLLISERRILTLLSEDSSLIRRVNGILSPEDFEDPMCRKIAEKMFASVSDPAGFSPAKILDSFEEAEEQKEAAAVFHEKSSDEMTEEEIEKSLTESIIRIKQIKLEKLIRDAKSAQDMQMIIKLKKELENFTLPA